MRKLIVAVVIMFIGTTGFSQGIDIDLGIKGGANFSNITNLKALKPKFKIGMQAGVFVGVKFAGKFGVQADLLYSQEGAKVEAVNGKFDVTYLNLPIVLKYYVMENQGVNIQVGPQFGFLVDDNIKGTYKGEEIVLNAKDSDMAAIIGIGYDFPDSGFRLDGRYHIGLTDIVDDPLAIGGRHKYMTIGIGYSFL